MSANDGACLADLIADGPLPSHRIIDVAMQLADEIAAHHKRAIPLGALTANTVFVRQDRGATISDSGFVAISGRLDADLMAFGIILYQMATGTAPYTGAGAEPPSPNALNPHLPSGLVQIIRRTLHPDAGSRFAHIDDINGALAEVRRAPGSLESLLPSEHISSTAAVKPPPRPDLDDPEDDAQAGLPFQPGG